MRKSIQNNLKIYTKGGNRRAGMFSDFDVKKLHEENPADKDKRNRHNVRMKIQKFIDGGKTLDEAVEILSKDEEILKQFEYLTKNGLNLATIFKTWYKPHINNSSKTCDIEVGEK